MAKWRGWTFWHEPYGDTVIGHYGDREFTIQHQRGWHINVDVYWKDRIDWRFTIVTNMKADRDMRLHTRRPIWKDHQVMGFEPIGPDRRIHWDLG